jgi:hypothetical protein
VTEEEEIIYRCKDCQRLEWRKNGKRWRRKHKGYTSRMSYKIAKRAYEKRRVKVKRKAIKAKDEGEARPPKEKAGRPFSHRKTMRNSRKCTPRPSRRGTVCRTRSRTNTALAAGRSPNLDRTSWQHEIHLD